MTGDSAGKLLAVREEVERVCRMLEAPTPARLDECAAVLQSAIGQINHLQAPGRKCGPRDREALDAAVQVRSALGRAGKLLGLARDYHLRWRSILGAMSSGYTAQGSAAAVPDQGRIWFHG